MFLLVKYNSNIFLPLGPLASVKRRHQVFRFIFFLMSINII